MAAPRRAATAVPTADKAAWKSAWRKCMRRPGEPQGLPADTERCNDVPAECFNRSTAGLVEGRCLEKRDVAMGPERSGLPDWAGEKNDCWERLRKQCRRSLKSS